jgi:hypothetical protein
MDRIRCLSRVDSLKSIKTFARVPAEIFEQLPREPRGALSKTVNDALRLWIVDQKGKPPRVPSADVIDGLDDIRYQISSIGINLNQLTKDWHQRALGGVIARFVR